MKNKKFIGTGVAIVTPFTSSKEVDFTSLKKIIEHLITNKIEYLVFLGTTGETTTLTDEEKHKIIAFAKESVKGRVPIVIGIGGNNTAEVVNSIKETDFNGIDAILSVSPYYNKPTQLGIYYHYKEVAEAAPVPVILYNVPGRTGSNICAETTIKLANDFKNIIAIKEASGNMEQYMQIIKNKPEDFLVISGDDALTLPSLSLGMDGVISVAAHANPLAFSNMVRLGLEGNFVEARKIHYQLLDVMLGIFLEGNPGGIKAILHSKELCENEVRLPLYPISDELYNKLKVM
jgi:4-hydroxy-tetrahydrodipicolinate synthase